MGTFSEMAIGGAPEPQPEQEYIWPFSLETPDIVAEGNALQHCVGGYVSRVAKKECIILFLRHADTPETSFFTIEVRGGVVAQVRGMQNCSPTPEVKSFMDVWEKKVLHRGSLPAAD